MTTTKEQRAAFHERLFGEPRAEREPTPAGAGSFEGGARTSVPTPRTPSEVMTEKLRNATGRA